MEPLSSDRVFSFGDAQLARLVIEGKKRATSASLGALKKLGIAVPEPGLVSLITDSLGNPICRIRTEKVEINAFRDVPVSVAIGEGEGDLSLAYWRAVHAAFFTDEAARLGLEFGETTEIVTEWFELLEVFSAA